MTFQNPSTIRLRERQFLQIILSSSGTARINFEQLSLYIVLAPARMKDQAIASFNINSLQIRLPL